jgi:hypothetical protein
VEYQIAKEKVLRRKLRDMCCSERERVRESEMAEREREREREREEERERETALGRRRAPLATHVPKPFVLCLRFT